MKQDVRHQLRNQQGHTLIEVMVAMVLIMALAFGGIIVINSLFNSIIRANQMHDQVTEVQTLYGWLNSNLQDADRPIGLLTDGGTAIDPLSIAGDQIIFESQGNCYRVFYLRHEEQVRAASAASCADVAVEPVRGPNELANSGTRHADPEDPDYDRALDAADGSFVLADGVVSEKPETAAATAPDPLVPFWFLTDEGSDIQVDHEASNDPGGHATFYSDPLNRQSIGGIEVWAYIASMAPSDGGVSVKPASRTQEIWIEQALSDPTAAGAVPSRGRIDGTGAVNWATVSPGGTWATVKRNSGSDLLETPSIGSQNAWLEFSGQLVLRPKTATSITGAEIKTELIKNGAVVSSGRSAFVVPTGQVTGTRAAAFAGEFQMPVGAVSPTDAYKLRVSIRNTDTTNELEYSTEIGYEWLRWKVVNY